MTSSCSVQKFLRPTSTRNHRFVAEPCRRGRSTSIVHGSLPTWTINIFHILNINRRLMSNIPLNQQTHVRIQTSWSHLAKHGLPLTADGSDHRRATTLFHPPPPSQWRICTLGRRYTPRRFDRPHWVPNAGVCSCNHASPDRSVGLLPVPDQGQPEKIHT